MTDQPTLVKCCVEICPARTPAGTPAPGWTCDTIGRPFCPAHPVDTACRDCGNDKGANRILCRACAIGEDGSCSAAGEVSVPNNSGSQMDNEPVAPLSLAENRARLDALCWPIERLNPVNGQPWTDEEKAGLGIPVEPAASQSRTTPDDPAASGDVADNPGFLRRVLAAFSKADAHDLLFWHGDGSRLFVNVNDQFAWGGADLEEITPERLPLLEQTLAELLELDAEEEFATLYAARIRGMRPQGAAYPEDQAVRALYDACGPERETGLGNPRPRPSDTGDPVATPRNAPDLRAQIATTLRTHGMVHLGDQVPADEYDCCADAVLAVVDAALPDRAQAAIRELQRQVRVRDEQLAAKGTVAVPAEAFASLVNVAQHVSTGKSAAFDGQGPYPDAMARHALGALDDAGLLDRTEPTP